MSEQVFAGLDARVSRYAYLVSLLPRRVIDDLGLRVRFVRRAVSSYTPDPRCGCARGLLVDPHDREAIRASFDAVTGDGAQFHAWERFQTMVGTVAQRVFPTLLDEVGL